MMRLIFMVFVLVSIFSLALASVAKPNCPEKCGNLTIPYPFGIGNDCSFSEEFNISCNATTNATKLYWFDYEVYRIENDSVGVVSITIPFIYNKSTGQSLYEGPPGYDRLGEYYSYSPTKNKFIAVGCDIFAYVTDWKTKEFVTGCPSLCNDSNDSYYFSSNSSNPCPGNGCCEASFSRELSDNMYWVHTMNTKPRSWASGQCSISAIVEKGFSNYMSKFNLSKCDEYHVPIVLDWAIGNRSCHDAQVDLVGSKNYTCGRNSQCVDSGRGFGYLCKCLPGYRGNPYLLDGCQDIDECNNPHENNVCPKGTICVNTAGSYFCSCQSGYHSENTNPRRPICLRDRGRQTMVMFVSLGVGLTVGLFILVASCLWVYRRMKKRAKDKTKKLFFKRNGGLLLQQKMSATNGNNSNVLETRVFISEELEKATDNFNESRVLGKGGLGTVYKGMLSDGSIVAVKKSNKIDDDENHVSQFINEVLILSQISHRHIVKLLGCCLETEVPLLVYEYVPNGTLTSHLHEHNNNNNDQTISWANRLRIATEVAGALAYLHSYASTAIFHRDVKSSNILLDENFRAVVSDFGLSRSVSIDRTHLTTVVGGTFGYLDPEYFCTGQLNDKSDVYAFGVVLAELVTGKKAIPSRGSGGGVREGLVFQFRSSIKLNRLFEIVDKTIWDDEEEKEIIALVANIALRCLKRSARTRPCMKEVAAELEHLRRGGRGGGGPVLLSELDLEMNNCENSNYSSSSERSFACTIDVVQEYTL